MLKLAHQQPLAIGNVRAIYQHPLQADLLIKIVRAEAIACISAVSIACSP